MSNKRKKNKNRQYDNNQESAELLQSQQVQQELDSTINYASTFAKSYLTDDAFISNPYIRNMILKDKNMNPRKQSKENLIKLLEDPKRNEKALRDFAEYLENITMQFKRLIGFFGSILSFDYFIEPTNADDEDMKTKSFKNSYKKVNDWLDRFNPKKQFPEIMKQILRNEVVYCYVRESKDNIFLQEMPIDYCKIISKTEYGYQYAFDMSYFFQTGTDIKHYDPIFLDYFESYKNNDAKYRSKSQFWIDLDPVKAPCFKFDETNAGAIPPFMSMFPDGMDISEYRELIRIKSELDLYKIILNKIPVHGGDGKTRKANDLAIDGNLAGTFSKVMENKLPNKTYMKAVTTPFESELVNFQRTENGNSEFDIGNKIFNNSSGVNSNIFGGDGSTATSIKISLDNATAFVVHMYPIFERFINVHLKQNTGKYRWKIHFEGTRYDREDRMKRAFQAAGGGFPKTFVAMAMGHTLETVNNMTKFENSIELVSKMIPIQSAHTSSNEGGRPEKDNSDLSNAGEQTRDDETNKR